MKKSSFLMLIFPLTALLTGILLSCSEKPAPAPDPALVAAHTGGIIRSTDPIEVVFTKEQDSSTAFSPENFRLKPQARGTLSWKNGSTLTFTPEAPLKPGTHYQVTVDGKALGMKPFGFSFETQVPTIELVLDPLFIDSAGDARVTGKLFVSEPSDTSQIEKILSSADLGLPSWSHENETHRFSFMPVRRLDADRTVTVSWTGSPIGAREKGSAAITVPARNLFKVMELRHDKGVLELVFSSPVKQYQDLRGFVSLSGDTNVRYSLEGNVIRIFGPREGTVTPGMELLVQDLEDINGLPLAEPVRYTVPSTWELPELRFAGTGNILPSSQGTSIVIETRNLSGLMVEAFLIPADNMIQFFQVNEIEGEQELYRVGESQWATSVDLPWKDSDQNRWVRHGLDLSELSRKYPDGMFRIRLSFRKRHIKYECPETHGDFSNLPFPDESFPAYANGGENYWDFINNSGYSWYDWSQQRKDPCHPAYYLSYYDHNIIVGRNVLVSDLGLLAKKGLDGTYLIAANNLKTAHPMANTDIEALNFQGRLLARFKTGSDGLVSMDSFIAQPGAGPAQSASGGTPYFLVAKNGPARAFLKLNDSLALATSHFDVAGDAPVEGLRGLIYGERGVWRPGDDIFLTFLLSDPAATLPADHPVSFELEDPRGRLSFQQTYSSSVDGFYPIAASTAADALTGDWIARVRVGGAVFTRNIKVETVMPNRLKVDLDFGPKDYIDGLKNNITLEAAWLYGAPAPGLKADISVSFTDRETSFNTYTEYSFRDPSRSVSVERQTVFEGTLDNAGRASFDMELKPGPAIPGKLSARFLTRVFEPSGVFSSEQISRDVSPYKRYVGLKLPRGNGAMLSTDTEHQADIVVLDGDGRPVKDAVSLDCSIYKLNWRWWWEQGDGERAEFSSDLSRTPVAQGTIISSGGKAAWNFRVKSPDWGRYLVVVQDTQGGHSASSIVYIDWPGSPSRDQEGGQGAAAMLTLSAGKSAYSPGEKISVSFPSNKEAAALAVVEKGGKILRSEWITCSDFLTEYEFSADPSMVPNIYVHVILLQPHLQTQNDLPLRLYGIIPVSVDDPRTRITPRIEAPETWLPESAVSFTVSEASGRPMVYTVAVVDQGLLGLTRYTLPNPRNTFYAKEASFLKSWDLFSDVLGAYSGQLETLLAIGGGDDEVLEGSKETQRFKPVVRFFGPYELKAGEQRPETFELPPYTGALRIMVMAASSSKESPESRQPNKSARAYGVAEKSVKVASDLMVFGTIPRLLSPGDEAEIPVSVNSYAPGARTVTIKLAAPGAELSDGGTQSVFFDIPGEKLIHFKLRSPDLSGQVRISITAESPGLRTASHITDLWIRSTVIPVTKSALSLIPPGEIWQGALEFPGRTGTNTGMAEFSRFPPINLESRLQYLIAYPHGCIEQTVSAVFPQLYLDRILTLDEKQTADIRTNITAGIEKLRGFQVPGGGFSYWPGEESAHDWGSTWAGHFLIEAKRAGYRVSDDMLNQFFHFQKDRAALWAANDGNPLSQAYRLYTLALASEADLGSMNRLRERRDLNPQAAWRLATAYWYAGQRDIARSMIRQLDPVAPEYRELSGTFGSELRDKAMILETLILLGESARTRPLFEELAGAMSGEHWLSTQETAYALIAMAPYMGEADNVKSSITADISLSDQNRSVSFTTPVIRLDLGNMAGTSGTYRVQNRSASPLYARITVTGLPEEGLESALSEGLSMTVEYRNMQGQAIDPDTLKPGDDMEVRLRVRNSYAQDVPEIALVHPIPASWELINYRLAGAPGDNSPASTYKYQDIRDDRVMTYFDLARGAEQTVIFRVNKTYGGTYFRPAIHAYAMYDESIRALIPGVRK
ncbi:alpha-2-macroglobulin domain protein [Treponema primitia ZAS-2]|uniref:Alpha-2-macroglobulin domain protein n=1 Tax=Treponema primitia (strain ATCC BAA-887 / DSM 12427 / ZAS-2) TaxID=545694 RepID=F5YGY1_TREPZ|nr:Ig-like domain-containing alpha-2-macroglobulin family protein [Treponema primitia]AEF86483.1 alpha-2-macroglobulin domain protein [Treponema primitia ZAS-2]